MLIAIRTLQFTGPGFHRSVSIRLFAPEQTQGGTWACRYEIDWPDKSREMIAAGEDSMQALVLALQMIGSELYTSEYHKAAQLVLDKPRGGYGFPVPRNLRDMLQGDDATFF